MLLVASTEIGLVLKAALARDLGNAFFSVFQQRIRNLEAEGIQIVNAALTRHALKNTAKVVFAELAYLRQLFHGERGGVIVVNL